MSDGTYEYRYESDDAISLTSGKRHPAIKVIYRRKGTRNYRHFLLVTNTPPAEIPQDVIVKAIVAHDKQR